MVFFMILKHHINSLWKKETVCTWIKHYWLFSANKITFLRLTLFKYIVILHIYQKHDVRDHDHPIYTLILFYLRKDYSCLTGAIKNINNNYLVQYKELRRGMPAAKISYGFVQVIQCTPCTNGHTFSKHFFSVSIFLMLTLTNSGLDLGTYFGISKH